MRTYLRTLSDRRDEHHAGSRREVLGRRRWLLSWRRHHDGRWLVRLSCPEFPETVERCCPTRREAIARAEEALTWTLLTLN